MKQFYVVEHLGCYLDANLSEESMAMASLKLRRSIQSYSSYIDKMSF